MKRFNSISTKMIVLLIFTSIMTLVINIIMFVNINQALGQIEQVYATNVQLNEMEEDLDKIQEQLFLICARKIQMNYKLTISVSRI